MKSARSQRNRDKEERGRREGGGGLRLREKLIPNDATRNGKKIFCREVRAPSLPPCNHLSPTSSSLRGPLVIPGKIGFTFGRELLVCAHISFLPCVLPRTPTLSTPSLSPFLPLFFLLFLPPAPVYIYFSPFPHPSNISLALHNGSDLKKRIF